MAAFHRAHHVQRAQQATGIGRIRGQAPAAGNRFHQLFGVAQPDDTVLSATHGEFGMSGSQVLVVDQYSDVSAGGDREVSELLRLRHAGGTANGADGLAGLGHERNRPFDQRPRQRAAGQHRRRLPHRAQRPRHRGP